MVFKSFSDDFCHTPTLFLYDRKACDHRLRLLERPLLASSFFCEQAEWDVSPSLAALHLFEPFRELFHHAAVVFGHVGLLLAVAAHIIELGLRAVAGLDDRPQVMTGPPAWGGMYFQRSVRRLTL